MVVQPMILDPWPARCTNRSNAPKPNSSAKAKRYYSPTEAPRGAFEGQHIRYHARASLPQYGAQLVTITLQALLVAKSKSPLHCYWLGSYLEGADTKLRVIFG